MTATPVAPSELAAALAPIERWFVVLDYDGTLSPIVNDPDAARPTAGAVDAIRAAAARTTVAVVSGRTVDDLRDKLGELPVVWAGGHGAEIVGRDGHRTQLVDPEAVHEILDRARTRLASLVDPDDGWLLEPKATSLAVHYRNVDEESAATTLPEVRAVLDGLRDEPPGFEVMEGKAVLELRARTTDKGQAVGRIADGLTPALEPLVIGDDVTDEDAFRVARSRGGQAVLVAETPRATEATWCLPDPDAVVALLTALVDAVPED